MPLRAPLRARTHRRLAATASVLLSLPALAACSGDSGGAAEDGRSAEDVLAEAATKLTETSGVELDLSTGTLPEGVSGIAKAAGTVTQAPAFEGSITVVFAGQTAEVPVIAVDDKVYAQLPFTQGAWDTVNPKEYGAPDPSQLVGEDGFAGLLGLTESPEEGESVRGGDNNTEVLTTYSGTVPGDAMDAIIPSSAGDSFDVEWQVNDDGELRKATLTGVFYPRSDPMTYTVEFDGYGAEKEITAP
ncbi:LppX_LprAFG lipoprotein [Microbacterium sp. ARD31]|uniref:LppX_LprAFG lipoprotein n=1 Tax=Microbacterium sp. ARD31 TaxID=2962576 RepID=UPI002881982B|nr:LppX_LprAFG lipoprotein [Microbacterium sp. ARD31]MDT0187198.1 LppX_LprAFG lipoprotein [Microbacterium sp. ARD31]